MQNQGGWALAYSINIATMSSRDTLLTHQKPEGQLEPQARLFTLHSISASWNMLTTLLRCFRAHVSTWQDDAVTPKYKCSPSRTFFYPVKLLLGEFTTSRPAPKGWVNSRKYEAKISDTEELYFRTKKISEATPYKLRRPGNQGQSRVSHTPRLGRSCNRETRKRQEIKEGALILWDVHTGPGGLPTDSRLRAQSLRYSPHEGLGIKGSRTPSPYSTAEQQSQDAPLVPVHTPLKGKSGNEDLVEARNRRGLQTAHAPAWSPRCRRAADVPILTGHSAQETGCKLEKAPLRTRGSLRSDRGDWVGKEGLRNEQCPCKEPSMCSPRSNSKDL